MTDADHFTAEQFRLRHGDATIEQERTWLAKANEEFRRWRRIKRLTMLQVEGHAAHAADLWTWPELRLPLDTAPESA